MDLLFNLKPTQGVKTETASFHFNLKSVKELNYVDVDIVVTLMSYLLPVATQDCHMITINHRHLFTLHLPPPP